MGARIAFVLTLLVAVAALALGAGSAGAAGGTVGGTKTVSDTDIACDGSTQVTLTLAGQTGIAGNPADIELVLDRSGSMAGTPLADLKAAASQFVDIVDEATDGALDGVIANGSRIGVVGFSSTATVDQPLTSSAAAVKASIAALAAGGLTNHQDAIDTAQAQLAASNPASLKKMIIFTDGQTTAGGDPNAAAAAARAAGTEIFAIGLGSVNVGQLDNWATDPDSTHVFVTPSSGDLTAIFQAIGAAITVPAATDITVVDTVGSHFAASGASATKGSVSATASSVTWTIDELGTETATLTFTATHDPATPGGVEAVNASVSYTDAEGHVVAFDSPEVSVHGCARTIDLAPPTATNELGTPGQTHTVTATVSDDFGDPVAGVPVSFSIGSGPNAGATGSGTTDAAGETPFTYTAAQGSAGLGTDSISACFVDGSGASVCDTAEKQWVDTSAPQASCDPTTNPSGENVPSAGQNPKSGQNPDGFYVLQGSDAVGVASIVVADSESSFVSDPFASGDAVKITQALGATPQDDRPGPGTIVSHLRLQGDAILRVTDTSGNVTEVSCLVPQPPK